MLEEKRRIYMQNLHKAKKRAGGEYVVLCFVYNYVMIKYQRPKVHSLRKGGTRQKNDTFP